MIEVIKGDITKLNAGAIVNAANSSLAGGGGVDGAIHRAAGPEVLEECREWIKVHHRCEPGNAMITTAGRLKAFYIIHTVGPVWNGRNEHDSAILSNAYRNSLELAVSHNLHSVAFPNISTGVYGYPKKEAAEVAVSTVKDFMKKSSAIEKVIFCCFDEENYRIYLDLL